VIEFVTALGIAENTVFVELEDELVGLDRDGKGLSGKSGLHGVGAGSINTGETGGVSGGSLGGIVGASTVGTKVGVGALGLSIVLLVVVEGSSLPATVATVADLDAIDELLLGEGSEVSVLDVVSTLKSTGGGEGPAGTALALILDGGDSTLSSPVNSVGNGGGVNFVSITEGVDIERCLVSIESVFLGLSPGGHAVVTDSVGVTFLVVLVDERVILSEDAVSSVEFLNGGVRVTEFGNVLHEVGKHS